VWCTMWRCYLCCLGSCISDDLAVTSAFMRSKPFVCLLYLFHATQAHSPVLISMFCSRQPDNNDTMDMGHCIMWSAQLSLYSFCPLMDGQAELTWLVDGANIHGLLSVMLAHYIHDKESSFSLLSTVKGALCGSGASK